MFFFCSTKDWVASLLMSLADHERLVIPPLPGWGRVFNLCYREFGKKEDLPTLHE